MKIYISPDIEILAIVPESVLCGSNEVLESNFSASRLRCFFVYISYICMICRYVSTMVVMTTV